MNRDQEGGDVDVEVCACAVCEFVCICVREVVLLFDLFLCWDARYLPVSFGLFSRDSRCLCSIVRIVDRDCIFNEL